MLDFIRVNTHSSIRIEDEKIMYADPFKIQGNPKDADIILITHEHFDHYSSEDIAKVMKNNTVIVCPDSMEITGISGVSVIKAAPNEKLDVCGMNIETVPAYNVSKQFHPKSRGWLGYIINSSSNGRIYIAGDTDITEDNMKVNCRIALVPIGGTFTMSANEAAKLINHIKPEFAVPVHYGSVAGSPEDAVVFCNDVSEEISAVEKIEYM